MNIIIAGSGKVGLTLARQLSAEGHDLTLIDSDASVLESAMEQLDVMAVRGNCASMPVLLQAGVREADLLITATNADEVNLLCCLTAHGINERIHTIARIRNPEYSDQIACMRENFALSMTVNPEYQAAAEIERVLKYPGFLRRDTFAKGRAEIVELRVGVQSRLCNTPLSALNGIVKCRVLVCAVLRAGAAVAPGGDFILREGDRIFVTAPTENLTVLLKNLGVITRRVRRAILCGGGRVSYYLAELLHKDGVNVQLIERDARRCRDLSAQLPADVCVICGDCSSQALLEKEGIAGCDALVSLTGIDETNMIISLYAASRGVRQIITKLGRAENAGIADSLTLGSVICPKELCSGSIVRYVRAMQNQTGAAVSVHPIADGQAEALEFLIDGTARNCGVPLKDLKLRANVLIASITHGASTEVPGGGSVFRRGDTVVVVTSGRGTLLRFNDIFA